MQYKHKNAIIIKNIDPPRPPTSPKSLGSVKIPKVTVPFQRLTNASQNDDNPSSPKSDAETL